MKAAFKIDCPDEVTATMTLTMTMGELRHLQYVFNKAGTMGTEEFSDLIDSLIRDVEQTWVKRGDV